VNPLTTPILRRDGVPATQAERITTDADLSGFLKA
jgi:hypothetical protein